MKSLKSSEETQGFEPAREKDTCRKEEVALEKEVKELLAWVCTALNYYFICLSVCFVSFCSVLFCCFFSLISGISMKKLC